MMRAGATFSEAWRNITSGTTRVLGLALALAAALILMVELEVSTTARLLNRADEFVGGGGSTYVLELSQGVSPLACDALAAAPEFLGAGALRKAKDVTVPALPDGPIPVYEASPGWLGLMASGESRSLLASTGLLDTFAPNFRAGGTRTVGGLIVDGELVWPDDGRVGPLSYAFIARAGAGAFDECWVRMADPTARPGALVRLAMSRTPAQGEESPVRQLNPRLGELTAFADFEQRTSRLAWMIAAVLAGLIALGAIRLRAVELVRARDVGVPAISQYAQAALEAAAWAVPAALVGAAYLCVRAEVLASTHFAELVALGTAIVTAGLCAAVAASLLGLAVVRRGTVDRYLRRRTG